MLSPDKVRDVKFRTVRIREGYDMMEVDEFLDRVHTELSDVERRRAKPGRTLTPAQTREVQFTTVRMREGYDMFEVDQFLDEVIATLEARQQDLPTVAGELTMLSSDQVRVVEFPTVRIREGYDMMEVDEFLDRVHTELSDVERRRAKPGRTLTPAQTREVQFTTVRIREGYDMRSVDEFLDEVTATLEAQQQDR